jgi:hypothetical protein
MMEVSASQYASQCLRFGILTAARRDSAPGSAKLVWRSTRWHRKLLDRRSLPAEAVILRWLP